MENKVENLIVEWLKSNYENATNLAHKICVLFSVRASLPHSTIREEYLKYKKEFDTKQWTALDSMNFDAWFMYGWRKHEEYLRNNEA